MEVVYILIPVFAFVLIKRAMDQRAQERTARLSLLENALKNPAVDRAAIEALAQQLTGRAPAPRRPSTGRGMAVLLALGWITLFTGIGIWVLGEMTGRPSTCSAGLLTSIIGFGFVTYPFALRELEARRPT